MFLAHLLLAIFEMTIIYTLTLALIGDSGTVKKNILSIAIITFVVYISRDYLKIVPGFNVLILACSLLCCLCLILKIKIIPSFTGVLLTLIINTFGTLIIVYPLLVRLGINLSFSKDGMSWIILGIAETIVPVMVLLILKITKKSLFSIGLK